MPTMRAAKTRLNLVPMSTKQQMLMTWWIPGISPHSDKDVVITDGAVRSGKTMIGGISYIMWAMYMFNHTSFGIAGKSLDSLKRNLWVPLQHWFDDIGIQVVRLRDTANGYILKYSYKDHLGNMVLKENYVYLFGGKDAGSAAFVQGFTAAGFFFDEVALQPEEFVNQAMARCSEEDSKIWFNCNPEGPFHWFKKQWIDKVDEKNALRIQFQMDDNPSLSERTLNRYRKRWQGVFYQRFILGEWVMAEGSIYKVFAEREYEYYIKYKPNNKSRKGIYVDGVFHPFEFINIGVDWGGNSSGHAFCATAITKDYKHVVVLKSKWYKATDTTPDQIMKWLGKFIREVRQYYGEIDAIYADSAEQILINLLREKTDIPVRNAIKGPIIDRIRFTLAVMAESRFFIVKDDCENVCEYFKTAIYDPKSVTVDKRLDDGSYDQDSGDAFEYSVEKFMPYIIREIEEEEVA